jgi:hypothetical protein
LEAANNLQNHDRKAYRKSGLAYYSPRYLAFKLTVILALDQCKRIERSPGKRRDIQTARSDSDDDTRGTAHGNC